MKELSDALKPWTVLRGEQPLENHGNRELSTRTVELLFAKFAAIFGTKLADQWAGIDLEKVKETWTQSLSELTRQEIVSGIQTMVRAGKPFPPTLPEFYGYCRPKVEVPSATDHAGLDAMARRMNVSTAGCDSYFALRQRLISRGNDWSPNVPQLTNGSN